MEPDENSSKEYIDLYNKNKDLLIYMVDCPKCINKQHTKNEHRVLYMRAYHRLEKAKKNIPKLYTRGVYKKHGLIII